MSVGTLGVAGGLLDAEDGAGCGAWTVGEGVGVGGVLWAR